MVQAYNPGYTQNSDGSYANNNYSGKAWQNFQLGYTPIPYFAPPDQLGTGAALTEWTSEHGFSGFCASALTIVYDQTTYAGGVPQPQWTVQGCKLYDPRKDSTYPGGSGAHRWGGPNLTAGNLVLTRNTWEWTDNPFIHALNYALGHWMPQDTDNGTGLYAGVGAGLSGVDIDAFIRGANIADANGWKICGQWTTDDGKWSVLTAMLQAGGGQLHQPAGKISCTVSTPLTSLGTITADDLMGPITLDTGVSMRERINTVFPSYSSEAHRWAVVQADTPVKAATYVAEDGGVRSKQLELQYVPAVNQACQLAAYAITDGREIPGIVLQGKPKLRNYAVGDCFTVNIAEAGLETTKVVVTKRTTDFSTGAVTLTVRTETDAKHAYSLGISGVAPPTPGISGFDPSIVPAPPPGSWTGGVTSNPDGSGEEIFVIEINGSVIDNLYAASVVVGYQLVTTVDGVDTYGDWVWDASSPSTATLINLNLPAGRYHVAIRYVTISGAQDVDNYLDLGILTVPAGTAATANALTGTGAAAIMAALNEQIIEAVSEVDQDETAADAALALAVQGVDDLLTQFDQTFDPDGLPIGPTLKQTNTVQNDLVSFNTTLGIKNDNGTISLNTDDLLIDNDGMSLAGQFNSIQSAHDSLAASVSNNYWTITEANDAIAESSDTLMSSFNDTIAGLGTTYATHADLNGATSTLEESFTAQYDGLNSELTVQAGAIATVQGRTDAYFEVSAGTGGAGANLLIQSDGHSGLVRVTAGIFAVGDSGAGTDVFFVSDNEVFVANQLFVGADAVIDPTIGGFISDNGVVKSIQARPFGASSNLLYWVGPSSVPNASCTTGNAYVYINTAGQLGGPGVPSGGGGGGGVTSGPVSGSALTSGTYYDYGTASFSDVASGALWNGVQGAINVTTSGSPGASTGSFLWEIFEAPHGTNSLTLIDSGALPWTYGPGPGFAFTQNENSSIAFTAQNKRASNSGAVDLRLKLSTTTSSAITGFVAGVSGGWLPPG